MTTGARAAVPDVDLTGAYIEAEDYTAMGAPNPWAWSVQSSVGGHVGSGYLYTTVGGTGTQPNGSRIDFPVNFTEPGTNQYRIWLRARDASPSGNGDSTFWGIDGVVMGALTEARVGGWEWTTRLQNGTNVANISQGNHVINLWPREPGQHTDSIFIIGSSQSLPGNVFEGSTAGVPSGHTALDFSGAGPGSGYITIPDGQTINGGPITMLDTTGGGSPGSQEIEYQTDQTGLQYRALGGQSDGFPGYSLDSKWTKTDIGNDTTVAPSVNDGTLTLTGAGADIWNTRDYFSYLYQGGINGDFTIDVKVNSQGNTNAWAKAGIMVRQSLAANSRHAMVVVTPSNGVRVQYRATDGASSTNPSPDDGNSAPEWLRLVRSGDTFTAWRSADGLNWTAVTGSASVTMSDPVFIGLAVTSHSTGNPSAVEFENFHFMPAATSGMSTTWNAATGSIDTTGWTDGTYALALNKGTYFAVNTFDYVDCVDGSPSSISIPGGQTVQGGSVSLPGLYSTGGNVSNFSYQINGGAVNSPWNSLAYGTGPTEPVTLSVFGTDPDCGGSLVSASQTITVDNTCTDPTPSTLTILTGQSTGGSSVDLTTMFSKTGNVGGLTYKINGTLVATPTAWDSTGYGLATPESVTLEVTGTDPECGGATISGVNTIEVDNTCTRNPPSISFDKTTNYAGPGRAIPYQVTIRNEDSFNCGATTFNVAITADPVNSNFVASYFNPGGSNTGIVLNGRQSSTIELAVEAESGAIEWAEKDTTLEITSVEDPGGAHNSPKTTGTVTTKVFLVSPITHNSVTTDSNLWGGTEDADGNTVTQGKWGTSETGSQYGNFDCLICHEKGGPNIKWMRGDITLPGLGTRPITFKDAREGPALPTLASENNDWGNDDPAATDIGEPTPNGAAGHTDSVRPCEVCHTQTAYHRYDTTGQTTLDHFNGRDCTDCHRHSLGFTASCDGCHGNPPLDPTIGGPTGLADIPAQTGSVTPGTHYKHVVVLGYECEFCHAGWRNVGEMPKLEPGSGKYQINHTFAVFGSSEPAATAGQYTGQDGVNYELVADLQARGIQDANGTVQPGKGTLTCENIYCHGGTDNMGGTNPQWNGNISCNSCHGTSATNTPPGYSHTTHVGQMGLACTICHGTSTGIGVNGHVNGDVHIDLSELRTGLSSPTAVYNGVGGTPDGAKWDSGKLAPSDPDVTDGPDLYGTCSNVACHYNVTTPVWNNNNQPATCTICHNDGLDSGLLDDSAPILAANDGHARHMSGSLMANAFIDKCQSCHGAGANTGDHDGHIDFDTDFAINVGWDNANSNCTNTCHEGDYINNLWYTAGDLTCDACHKSPYIGPTVVDPNNGGAGMAASGYGSHLKETKNENLGLVADWSAQCKKCHPYHTSGSGVVDIPLPPAEWDGAAIASGTSSPLMGPGSDMRQKLGLNFPITDAIHLGGTATTTAGWYYDPGNPTEAEMCWGCHGLDTEVNEWGFNADSNGGTFPVVDIAVQTTSPPGHSYWNPGAKGSYNNGYLYDSGGWAAGNATAKWVDNNGRGMYRRDGYQHDTTRMSRRISSVHSVDFTLADTDDGASVKRNINGTGDVIRDATQKLETVDRIRCSYCHDVHDLNMAQVSAGVNETATGRPYLRGTWMGNPYPPDMPPLSGYTYNSNGGSDSRGNRYYWGSNEWNTGDATPRLFVSTSQDKGGYFIDANSGRPTTDAQYDTVDETAGICVLCHGNDVDNMDYYNNASSMWRTDQVNGHANSALGGSGAAHANAKNIFDARRTTSNYIFMGFQEQSIPRTVNDWGKIIYDGVSAEGDAPYRQWGQPGQSTSNMPGSNSGWYGGVERANYTNAADRSSKVPQYDVWFKGSTDPDDATAIGHDGSGSGRAHSFTCSKCHSPHAAGLPALIITNCLDRKQATWTGTNKTAIGPNTGNAWTERVQNNCHRKDGTGSGWHRLSIKQ